MPRKGLCLAVAALVAVAGCGSGTPGGQKPVATTSTTGNDTDSPSPPEASPPAETSGTEEPRPPADQPSLAVAALPIGGGVTGRCLTVEFDATQPYLRPGVSVVVTGVAFDRSVVRVGGSGCSAATPLCLAGFVVTADSTGDCAVPIVASAGAELTVTLRGMLQCDAGPTPTCLKIRRQLLANAAPLPITVAAAPSGST